MLAGVSFYTVAFGCITAGVAQHLACLLRDQAPPFLNHTAAVSCAVPCCVVCVQTRVVAEAAEDVKGTSVALNL